MKHLFLIITLLLSASGAFAQDWEEVAIDSAVSVKLPQGFDKTDDGGDYSLVAISPFGTIMVFKAPDNPQVIPDIERERHLNRFYADYVKKVRTSSQGGIIRNERDTVLGNLKVKDFTLEIDSGSGVLYRDFRVLHANNATYTFEFLYQDLHRQMAEPEKQRFFNSIVVDERLERADQFTAGSAPPETPTGRKYLLWGIGAAILGILLFVLSIFRKRRRMSL